jgi:Trk-type K+ transport system membrane component
MIDKLRDDDEKTLRDLRIRCVEEDSLRDFLWVFVYFVCLLLVCLFLLSKYIYG